MNQVIKFAANHLTSTNFKSNVGDELSEPINDKSNDLEFRRPNDSEFRKSIGTCNLETDSIMETSFFKTHPVNHKHYNKSSESIVRNSSGKTVKFIENTSDRLKYDFLSNSCICMIDIVGFSAWCSNHLPNVIAKAMLEYNDWICNSIEKYPSIRKIELVGDSCMLVSGLVDDNHEELIDSYLSMIRLAFDLLEDIKHFKNIFKCASMAIRIGINVADVIGLYLENPNKYQIFGNDINVCSRLESSCIPNSIHISDKTLMCVQNACKTTCGPCSRSVKSGPIYQKYKGIGYKYSYQLFLKKKEICIVNTSTIFTKNILKSLEDNGSYNFITPNTLQECIMDCNAYKYIGIVINLSDKRNKWNDVEDLVTSLKNMKHFEQRVCLITSDDKIDNLIREYSYNFEYIISFETDDFYMKLHSYLDEWSHVFNEKGTRGSLDLTLN